MSRFPKDCWNKNCEHFHVMDMSVDDLLCACDVLGYECDACDEDYCHLRCPLAEKAVLDTGNAGHHIFSVKGEIQIKVKLDEGAYLPSRAHEEDAGLDLRSPDNYRIPPRGSVVINTGVHVEIPLGFAGLLVSKSGLNVKHGITSDGLIDSGYSGAIIAKLYNNTDTEYAVTKGDKITQLVVVPCLLAAVELEDFEGGKRGANGFGSTGK